MEVGAKATRYVIVLRFIWYCQLTSPALQSCETGIYVHNLHSQVVNTSFAILALITCQYHKVDPEPIRRACRLIMSRQNHDGSWAQESIEGGSFECPV